MALISTLLICFILVLKALRTGASVTPSFPIGGLFNDETLHSSKNAFEKISRKGDGNEYHGSIFYTNFLDSYSTALKMCQNTSNGKPGSVAALIDARPTNGVCDYTCLLCNRLNISHLSLGWQPTETHTTDLFTFSYHPPPEVISIAFATLLKEAHWNKMTFFYEDEGSFIRLQEVINTWPLENDAIVYRRLDPIGDNRETFKTVLKELRINNHILDCEVDHISKYVKEILAVEKSMQYQNFILTNLDSHLYRFEDEDFIANVSTLHMTVKNDDKLLDSGLEPNIKMETALTADALNHLKKAIRALVVGDYSDEEFMRRLHSRNIENPPPICFADIVSEYSDAAWPLGKDFREALLRTTVPEGYTGNIEFDENGKRTNVKLHYSVMIKGEFVRTGYWDSTKDIIYQENNGQVLVTLPNAVLRVQTKIQQPYFYNITSENGTKIEKGYVIDLIEEIVNFIAHDNETKEQIKIEQIKFSTSDDGIGSFNEDKKKWDGILGKVMSYEADIGICDLTITSVRNEVVDFSVPFMSTGIALLFKVADPEIPDMFSFIRPLSFDVWLYLATTYIGVSVVLLICARMSQQDWVNPHPCNQNPDNLQNIWSLYNCMWLTMGTIMTQGCDILPRGIGSRWITGMWWFFAMIVTASYTANMSSFISSDRRSNEINEVADLADQTAISYGAVNASSTYNFFKDSNDSLHKKLWTAMDSARPSVFEKSNNDGKDRVLKSKRNYAFFMESTQINYYTERNCSLKMVGSELDSKTYGIAMPKGSFLKPIIDRALLKLQENGKMSDLQEKWWKKEDNNAKDCNTQTQSAKGLEMKNTSGIFLVLGLGGILGLIVAIIDFLMHAHDISVQEKVTFKEAILSEWRASLDPRLLSKPVAPPRSAPASPSPSLQRARSRSRAVSVLKAATSFINFDEIY